MKVIIAGAGIGGLTAALCLHEKGIEVEVFESVKEIKPLGVGINTLPHCIRVLTNLGLQEKIAQWAVETSDLVYFNRYGQQFWSEPRGKNAGYKWPQFSLHRGKLQMLLFDECVLRLGEKAIHTNAHLESFEQDSTGVTARFIDKNTGEIRYTTKGDVLIGADGINSEVRAQLYPNEGPPLYSENVLYRGTTFMQPFLNGRSMAMIGSLKQKMVAYPISQPDKDGLVQMNWVANIKEGKSTLKERDWNRQADQQRLVKKYKEWQFDWLDVKTMVEKADAVYEFPMSDRDPLEKWTFGKVSLLGDAAHPMYPIGSNGASQAILDAEYLAESLSQASSIEEALLSYENERRPATGKVVLQNRKKGPDQIMDMMEEWFPQGFEPNEIPHDKLKEVMDNYRKVAGFDKETLNAKK
ncbi:flavin-dependent oxidoreductase [Jiulongibacter sp. NS-SX5]|uniref:flavin-dependent oxidoreductase n=1 Tax=Jiulongibacter sp. NS-SX5 TaxID=3463854 RepID=UPI0040587C49